MNDGGLSLTPSDMLKGYLLANITDAERRRRASRAWNRPVGLGNVLGRFRIELEGGEDDEPDRRRSMP